MTGRASAIFAPMVVEEFESQQIIIFLFLSIIAVFSVGFIKKPHEGEVRYIPGEDFEEHQKLGEEDLAFKNKQFNQ